MTGESGKGKHGKVYYYYKCGHAKRKGTCNLKAVKKDWIERLVVEETKQFVLQDEVIIKLADSVIAHQDRENALLPMLQKQLQDAEKAIRNMLSAIEQGIITSSTKQRLEELEALKAELEAAIAQEKMGKVTLTKEQIVFWISQFKDGNVGDPAYQKKIIDIFVNAVYVYDDKLVLLYNYKDGAMTVKLEELEGSDLEGLAPPQFVRKVPKLGAFLRVGKK